MPPLALIYDITTTQASWTYIIYGPINRWLRPPVPVKLPLRQFPKLWNFENCLGYFGEVFEIGQVIVADSGRSFDNFSGFKAMIAAESAQLRRRLLNNSCISDILMRHLWYKFSQFRLLKSLLIANGGFWAFGKKV